MEKRISTTSSDFFSSPQRQHIYGLLIILFKQFRASVSSFLGFLIYILTAEDTKIIAIYGIIIFILIYIFIAVVRYINIKFHLHHGEFICESGVFTKKKITIPFDKIMNIDYEQNIVQQILDIAKLKVETSGSNDEEIELYALSLHKIKEIRNIIFEYKGNSENIKQDYDEPIPTVPTTQRKLIYQLSAVNLLKSGITANHLETAALILALVFSFSQRLRDLKILGEFEEYEKNIYNFLSTVKVIFIVTIVFLFISVISSMLRQVVIYFALKFYRTADGFYISKGLFTKKLMAVKDDKIQSIDIKQTLLRKWIGMYDFSLQKVGDFKQKINIPGMDTKYVNKTIEILYPSYFNKSYDFHPISHKYFIRSTIFISLLTLIAVLTGYVFKKYTLIVGAILLSIYLIRRFYLKTKKLKFAISDEFLVIMGGKFGTKHKIIPISKIQMISLSDSPYQRKHRLKTLYITDGGSTSTVPFIPSSLGREIYEYLLYLIEKTG